jgi:hypothetical protein
MCVKYQKYELIDRSYVIRQFERLKLTLGIGLLECFEHCFLDLSILHCRYSLPHLYILAKLTRLKYPDHKTSSLPSKGRLMLISLNGVQLRNLVIVMYRRLRLTKIAESSSDNYIYNTSYSCLS